jgi:cytochrome c oxidase subunit II
MMKRYLLLLGVIFMFLISACSEQAAEDSGTVPGDVIEEPEVYIPEVEETSAPLDEPTEIEPQTEPVTDFPADDFETSVVEIDMIAKQWDFTPSTITVQEGDEVKLNIQNVDVSHGFALFEFGVNEQLIPGETTTVEFIADKAGEYTFFCSVPCGQGHRHMEGKLIVE